MVRFVSFAVVGIAVYLTASTFISLDDIEKRLRFEEPVSSRSNRDSAEDPFGMKPVAYYLERLDDRDIFKIGGRLTKNDAEASQAAEPSPKVAEATRDLRLVGISWSDSPDAMTFFLKEGDRMENGIRVKRIDKDKVILSAEGQELELQ